MEHGGYLFTKIRFPGHDVIVPFVCTRCGWCCEHYIPHLLPKEVLRIAEDEHWQGEETLRIYLEDYDGKLHGHPGPCPFLGKDRLCTIHGHPLRPEVCRLYPFSFRGGDERCPPFRDHRRIVDAFTAGAGDFELYDSSFCPDEAPRPIPAGAWLSILHRFLAADPPAGVIAPFVAVNRPPDKAENQGADLTARSAWRAAMRTGSQALE